MSMKIPAMTFLDECKEFVFLRSNSFKASLQLMPIVSCPYSCEKLPEEMVLPDVLGDVHGILDGCDQEIEIWLSVERFIDSRNELEE
jgi:hypothetical protein